MTKACGKYLLACRMASVAEIKRDVLSKRGRYVVLKIISMPKKSSSAMANGANVIFFATIPRRPPARRNTVTRSLSC